MTFPYSVMCFTRFPGKEREATMQFPLSKTFLIVVTNPKPNLTLTEIENYSTIVPNVAFDLI